MRQMRILVVDGSSLSRELISRQLTAVLNNTEVMSCGSAAEALDLLNTQRFDLITTAMTLREMDGLGLCRRVRQSAQHSFTPVIIIASDADERLRREGFAAGVTDYFDKGRGHHAMGEFIRAFQERNTRFFGHILYVEDSATVAAITRRIFDKHSLHITHTLSAEQALQRLAEARTQGDEFDMVVTDFHLSGEMTGGDLLHALRVTHHFSHQELPVLVITGDDDPRTQIEAFHAGANDYVTKPIIQEIMLARIRSLLLIRHQYKAIKYQAEAMQQMAITDGLTGVHNRRYLQERGPELLTDHSRLPLAVLLLDLDHFKQINDTHGHLIGDQVLASLGALLRERCPGGLCVRFGGEEFVVLLPACPDPQPAAEALRRAVEALYPAGLAVTCSIGTALSRDFPGHDISALIGEADRGLYAAKAAGRNRICRATGC